MRRPPLLVACALFATLLSACGPPPSSTAPMGRSCTDALGLVRLDGCSGYNACASGGLAICTCTDGALVDCGPCADPDGPGAAPRPSRPEPTYCGSGNDAGAPRDAGTTTDAGPAEMPPPGSCTSSRGTVADRACGWTRRLGSVDLDSDAYAQCQSGSFRYDERACPTPGGPVTAVLAAIPRRRELTALRMTPDDRIFISNNPERIASTGVIVSTVSAPGARRDAPMWRLSPPVASLDGSTSLEAGCPAGSVREMDVYIAHIAEGNAFDISLGVVPASEDITVTVEGDLAVGPWSTRAMPSFVSATVMRNFYGGRRGTRSVRAACGASGGSCRRYTEVDSAGGEGYIDGRLRLASSGCFQIYVLSKNVGSAAPTSVPSTWATGNVAWEDWYVPRPGAPPEGAGRSAGIYAGGNLSARAEVRFNGAGQSRGFVVGLEATAQPAQLRLTDSARVNFGDYGGVYHLTFDVSNRGGRCIEVTSELVSYANVPGDAQPTFRVFNAIGGELQWMYWNSAIERSGGREGTVPNDIVLSPARTSDSTRFDDIVPSMRSRQHVERLVPGESRALTLRVQIPGLITAPLGVVWTTAPCR